MSCLEKVKNDKNEIQWQYAFYNYVEGNDFTFVTENGKNGNLLNIGEHNRLEGPDFKNSCVIIDGKILTGDIEFHKKSSDWLTHKHNEDTAYNNIILHIVFEHNIKLKTRFDTVVINRSSLEKYTYKQKSNTYRNKIESDSTKAVNNEIQEYAINRLVRKTSNIYNLLQHNNIYETLIILTKFFLNKYFKFRRRPLYNISLIDNVLSNLKTSKLLIFLYNLNDEKYNFDALLSSFFEIPDIGNHLKQEIWTNVVFPLAFCLANSSKKAELLFWYWNAKTKIKYGILNKHYPQMQQNYVWQQQGLLEYYKESINYKNVDQEILFVNCYLPEFLSYHSLKKSPYTFISV